MRKCLLLFPCLLINSAIAAAQDVDTFEKILLPVITHGLIPGIGGEFSAVAHVYSPIPCRIVGAEFRGQSSSMKIEGDGWLDVDLPGNSRAYGRFVYLERSCADQVSLSLGAGSKAGAVALPIPRERDWRTGTTEFLGAGYVYRDLTRPTARLKLRAFDYEGSGFGELLVRVILSPQGVPNGEYSMRLNRRDGNDRGSPFYAELDLPVPCIRFTHSQLDCEPWPIRIQITPLVTGLRYWAIFTSTSNESQHIFVPLPQP